MVIRFDIPHGTMSICPDVFFREATRGRIRRVFKLMRQSGSGTEQVREWLDGEIQAGFWRAKGSVGDHLTRRSELKELTDLYDQMQSPCYAVYTTDKRQLAEARKRISRCRTAARASQKAASEDVKLYERYKGILEDVDTIFKEDEHGSKAHIAHD